MENYFVTRNALRVLGNPAAAETLVFAHGYGTDQTAWRHVWPAFEDRYRLVLFDLVGCGASDRAAYDHRLHRTLDGYAEDLIHLCDHLQLRGARLIGHSVSGMIGALAAVRRPDLFAELIMLGASPCYLNDGDYQGGFAREDVAQLLSTMSEHYLAWVKGMAPRVAAEPHHSHLAEEFERHLSAMRPDVSFNIATTIFLSDYRQEVAQLRLPVLVLQGHQDIFVPPAVAEFLHQTIPNSTLRWLDAAGHFPHLTQPGEVVAALREYFQRGPSP